MGNSNWNLLVENQETRKLHPLLVLFVIIFQLAGKVFFWVSYPPHNSRRKKAGRDQRSKNA